MDTSFLSDLDGTLTFFPGIPGQPFLGEPLSPAEATKPMSEWTRKLVQIMFTANEVPDRMQTGILTGNSESNARQFLEWTGVSPDSVQIISARQSGNKLEIAREQLQNREGYVYILEDSIRLIQNLLLEFPEKVIPVPCYRRIHDKRENYPLPRQVSDFLGHSDPKRLTEDDWFDFLEDIFDQFDPEPWIRSKELIGENNFSIGPKYITVKSKKPLFRIRLEDWMVLRPTGTVILSDIWNFEP